MLERIPITGSELATYKGMLPEPKGGAKNFAFLVHALSRDDLLIIEPKIKKFLDIEEKRGKGNLVQKMLEGIGIRPFGHCVVRSHGRESHGIFLLIPYFPESFQDRNKIPKIIEIQKQALEIAQKMNAHYVGLGAFNSIVSRNGQILDQAGILPVTSGNSLTAASVEMALLRACKIFGKNPKKSTLCVVGATGSIGRAVCTLLAERFSKLMIVARDEKKLEVLKRNLKTEEEVTLETNLNRAIEKSEIIIFATSSPEPLPINPQVFRPGAIICDVSRPHNISPEIIKARNDIFCFEGGIFDFPGQLSPEAEIILRMGGPNQAFGCLSETMLWALEGENGSRSIGLFLETDTVRFLEELAHYYKFKLAGFRMFDQPIPPEEIKAKKILFRQICQKRFQISPNPSF